MCVCVTNILLNEKQKRRNRSTMNSSLAAFSATLSAKSLAVSASLNVNTYLGRGNESQRAIYPNFFPRDFSPTDFPTYTVHPPTLSPQTF